MNELEVRTIDEEALALYARIVEADGLIDDHDAQVRAALEAVRQEFGLEVETLVFEAQKADSSLGVLEVHSRSPQLTIAFDADWVLTILVAQVEPRLAAARDLVAYSVPARAAVLLREGVWHGPVAPIAPSRVAVTFTEGALDETDVIHLAVPIPVSR